MIIYYSKQPGAVERVNFALWSRNGHDSYEIGPLSLYCKYRFNGAVFTPRYKEYAQINTLSLLALTATHFHLVVTRVQ
jgi:hypothetical protein